MKRNAFVAYALWFVGGWLGLHHFYLRRDRQAFLWWCTLGGFFGVGWLRDFFQIPEYVEDANENPSYIAQLRAKMAVRPRPPFSMQRFVVEVLTGALFGFLIHSAVPEELLETFPKCRLLINLVVPFGVAIGVHLVGNIGRETLSLKTALIGAYVLPWNFLTVEVQFSYCAILSALITNWFSRDWLRITPKQHSVLRRSVVLFLCATIYLSLWSSVLLNNTYVTTKYGERVRFRDAARNFFTSPAWQEMKFTFHTAYRDGVKFGWTKSWSHLVQSIDPEGEANAFKVLQLPSDASQAEITAQYRKLAKEWHPDRHQAPADKQIAQEKFMAIQSAYELLSKIKTRRANKSQRPDRDRTEF